MYNNRSKNVLAWMRNCAAVSDSGDQRPNLIPQSSIFEYCLILIYRNYKVEISV